MKTFWDSNLAALQQRTDAWPLLSILSELGPAPDLGLRDRQGRTLPGLVHQGRPRSLVSTYDAEKEALRWSDGWKGGAAAVFGAASRSAADALTSASLLFWVEPRVEIWRSLFTWEDWAQWLEREEWIPVFGDAAAFQSLVLDRYHPLWDGAFRTFDWKSSTTGQEETWDPYRRSVTTALDVLASDTSTQARFGERWYRNALVNLQRLKSAEVAACVGAKVVIAGAGPTLDDALDDLENRRWLMGRAATGDRLFSTDTALPALTERGIVPDLILCLDGQLPSYHHFVPARPSGVTLAADLASLPFLSRIGMPVVRYLSGHPFGTVVKRYFPELPVLDGSLGNVSGLARAAACALGAAGIETWGVDFAYRDGQAYARGTYVYPLAQRVSGRLSPLETRLGVSCYAARGRERVQDASGRMWDTTPLLRDYRNRWNQAVQKPGRVNLAHGDAGNRWNLFRCDWQRRLESLPMPGPSIPFHSFVRNLPAEQRQDWLALWPLALALHRQRELPLEVLLETVKTRALSFLTH